MKTYIIDGIKVKVDPKIMTKWSVAGLFSEIESGDIMAAIKLIKRILGDQTDSVLLALDPEGDPDINIVSDFFLKLMEAMTNDTEAKK